jgi:hypothetical protein
VDKQWMTIDKQWMNSRLTIGSKQMTVKESVFDSPVFLGDFFDNTDHLGILLTIRIPYSFWRCRITSIFSLNPAHTRMRWTLFVKISSFFHISRILCHKRLFRDSLRASSYVDQQTNFLASNEALSWAFSPGAWVFLDVGS